MNELLKDPGYKAKLISTIVDSCFRPLNLPGYKAKLISTIVDINTLCPLVVVAIKPN